MRLKNVRSKKRAFGCEQGLTSLQGQDSQRKHMYSFQLIVSV